MSAASLLDGQRILIFVGDEYEDLELWYPKLRLIEAGAHVTVAGQKASVTYQGKHGYPCLSDTSISLMESGDFQGLVCAGGWMPDKLRRDPKVLSLTQEFAAAGKLVAAICHGGWIPISANVYRGFVLRAHRGSRTIWSMRGPFLRTQRWSLIAILSAVVVLTIFPHSAGECCRCLPPQVEFKTQLSVAIGRTGNLPAESCGGNVFLKSPC